MSLKAANEPASQSEPWHKAAPPAPARAALQLSPSRPQKILAAPFRRVTWLARALLQDLLQTSAQLTASTHLYALAPLVPENSAAPSLPSPVFPAPCLEEEVCVSESDWSLVLSVLSTLSPKQPLYKVEKTHSNIYAATKNARYWSASMKR